MKPISPGQIRISLGATMPNPRLDLPRCLALPATIVAWAAIGRDLGWW